jgi:hypothetical protein
MRCASARTQNISCMLASERVGCAHEHEDANAFSSLYEQRDQREAAASSDECYQTLRSVLKRSAVLPNASLCNSPVASRKIFFCPEVDDSSDADPARLTHETFADSLLEEDLWWPKRRQPRRRPPRRRPRRRPPRRSSVANLSTVTPSRELPHGTAFNSRLRCDDRSRNFAASSNNEKGTPGLLAGRFYCARGQSQNRRRNQNALPQRAQRTLRKRG